VNGRPDHWPDDYEGGPIAMKLLQGYLWHPLTLGRPELPPNLEMGASLVIDPVRAPMAFFANGEPTASQQFYQLTVLEIFLDWPSNETMHERAALASAELDPILNATDPSVGWSLQEDLRPA
jgi:hypothetical protein